MSLGKMTWHGAMLLRVVSDEHIAFICKGDDHPIGVCSTKDGQNTVTIASLAAALIQHILTHHADQALMGALHEDMRLDELAEAMSGGQPTHLTVVKD